MNKLTLFAVFLLIAVVTTGCPRRTRVVYVEKDHHEPHYDNNQYSQHQNNQYDDSYYDKSYDSSYDSGACVEQAPPQIIIEHHRPRRPANNYVWVDGHWRWNGYKYVWVGGHWRKTPRGYKKWHSGRWEKRSRGWIWIEGRWN